MASGYFALPCYKGASGSHQSSSHSSADSSIQTVTSGCQDCRGPEINRKPRTRTPHIHYGTIATGSQVVKNAALRDSIGAETGAICIEMEATGVMVTKGCLVIRGICDYADSHKNDDWHKNAAATAAAYLRYLLFETPPQAP
ncbi:uncharacterized protein TRIVIDRAFT_219748 [Trichoderma virens Gv29-8]|uniref:Nucleoside phosphorylase domain-containing protein n=1 Tax=Hypocrea virens (strain Gv29-8 / FGSC 10586) TaxID=413071 RepID=G9MLR5_HYPVG|nr:uncharacterized protein TRIVIDRAFT_219748 [Trichoderma virens Gv29-8]EHK24292.1 hypothetical protein TRIVIDRAFT_219748 [Trichoderma virens Gv29-8]UKZ54556.1 hypothetical protein TrVGV298_008365 [Trichoderma virens]